MSLFFAYKEHWPQMPIYCYAVVLVLALLFADSWPFDHIGVLRIVVQNYWVNAVLLVGLSIYMFFSLPTLIGGVCAALSGIMFAAAAATGEKGKTLAQLRTGTSGAVSG